MVSGKDILWTVSLPFRIRNTSELDLYEFLNLLVFETFNALDIEIAKKLLTLAKEKEFIAIENGKIRFLLPKLWKPAIYKLDWKPNLEGIEEVKEYEIDPLPTVPELIFIPNEIKKMEKVVETDSIETAIKEIPKKKSKVKKEKKIKKAKKETVLKEKKKKKSKKDSQIKLKKVVEKKGKSLDDFF